MATEPGAESEWPEAEGEAEAEAEAEKAPECSVEGWRDEARRAGDMEWLTW